MGECASGRNTRIISRPNVPTYDGCMAASGRSSRKGIKQMTANNWLFIVIMGLIIFTAYLAATKPKITEQERKEMEEDWWG
jgi:hypothetical protein